MIHRHYSLRFQAVGLFCALLLSTANLLWAQTESVTPTQVIATSEATLAAIRADIDTKVTAVESALAAAAKAGTLKPSTDAYFRDALDRFKAPPGRLPNWTQLYYPPKFDTSEEMEPINLAWSALRDAATAGQEATRKASDALLWAAGEVLLKVAQSGEKPEELDPVRELLAMQQRIGEVDRSRSYSLGMTGAPMTLADTVSRLAEALRRTLDAKQKGDLALLVTALQRISPRNGYFPEDRATLPFRIDTLWDDFRKRVTAGQRAEMKIAQEAVERALIARKPIGEIDKLITDFQTKADNVDRLTRDPNQAGYNPQNRTAAVAQRYQRAAETIAGLAAGRRVTGSNMAYVGGDESLALPAEYRAFEQSLSQEAQQQERALQAKEQEERERKERDRQAEGQRLAEETLRKVTETVREKLAAVTSAKQALSLADELPGLTEPLRSARGEVRNLDLSQTQAELRQIGAWWLTADGGSEITRANSYERSGSGPFVAEMSALRERALRAIVAEQFHAPEILKPPFMELNARAAVEQLAQQVAAAGGWARAYELLQATAQANGTLLQSGRMQAIRSYLTGLNMEQAEQWTEAVRAYQTVLQQIGTNLPTKEAAARLKELRANHPEAVLSAGERPANLPLDPVRALGR